jgi:hypothetical protein
MTNRALLQAIDSNDQSMLGPPWLSAAPIVVHAWQAPNSKRHSFLVMQENHERITAAAQADLGKLPNNPLSIIE